MLCSLHRKSYARYRFIISWMWSDFGLDNGDDEFAPTYLVMCQLFTLVKMIGASIGSALAWLMVNHQRVSKHLSHDPLSIELLFQKVFDLTCKCTAPL